MVFPWSIYNKWFGTNKILYNIFGLRHMSKLAADFQKKKKMFIYSLKCPNKGSGKY